MAVTQQRAEGFGEPLPKKPDLKGTRQVLVSDAISTVEIAHVNFKTGAYFISQQNPWTYETRWFGPFQLPAA